MSSFFKNAKVFTYILGAFLIFTAGFFIVHGREAKASGSWDFVITHDDEFYYWAVAKGASQTPMSDENPYYYEEMGQRMSLPWTTAILTGRLAKLLRVPVMTFFPIWHIGMPFVMWLSLFLCLWKIWKYPMPQSAAFSMIFLLSTLFFRGQTKILLFRFSRPGDGLWLLFIWVSLVMNPLKNLKWQTLILCLIAFVAFWLQPLYTLIGIVTTFFEMGRCLVREKDKTYAGFLFFTLVSIAAAAFTYFLYFRASTANDSWLAKSLAQSIAMQGKFNWVSLVFFAFICAFTVLPRWWAKKPLTPLARLTLYAFLIDPVLVNLSFFLPWSPFCWEVLGHRYYFFVIQMACLTGIMIENVSMAFLQPWFQKVGKFLAVGSICTLVGFLSSESTYFLLYVLPGFPSVSPVAMSFFSTSLLLFCIFLIVFSCVWMYYHFALVRRLFLSEKFVVTAIILLGLAGYSFMPSFLRWINQDYPFRGAYQWFRDHGKKNEVVLTIPVKLTKFDYLILQTDMKSYYARSDMIDNKKIVNQYRWAFYQDLFLGMVDGGLLGNGWTLDEKLKNVKLDYILVAQKAVAFAPVVKLQLGDRLKKVYEDKTSQIWRVS